MQGRSLSTAILCFKKCNIHDTFGRRQTDSGHVPQSPYLPVFHKCVNGFKLFPSDAQEILFSQTDQDFLTASCEAIYRLAMHFLGPINSFYPTKDFGSFLKWSVGYLGNENTLKTLVHYW